MLVIQRAREEAILPEMSCPPVKAVDVQSVQVMSSPEGFGQRVNPLRRSDQVDMVGHQAVRFNRKPEPSRLRGQKFQIHSAVVIDEKYILLVVAPLRDVVRRSRNDYSGKSGHSRTVPSNCRIVQNNYHLISHLKMVTVPILYDVCMALKLGTVTYFFTGTSPLGSSCAAGPPATVGAGVQARSQAWVELSLGNCRDNHT